MPYDANTGPKGASPMLQVCDATSGSVRVAWETSREPPAMTEEERELWALRREEAIHGLFRRLFPLTAERYLCGELGMAPRLGAWRRSRRRD